MVSASPVRSFKIDNLEIKVYDSSIQLGQAAAHVVSKKLQESIVRRNEAKLILATGASQFDFLEAFKKDKLVDWSRVTVFHLDEYEGISIDHPASFRKYLKERILDEVKPSRVHFLEGDSKSPESEVIRYETLLKSNEIDVACIGIGENGHIAFNDPPVADFSDPKLVKVVELDDACKRQQWQEGWFVSLEDVPKTALTLTIPAIMKSNFISCVVPDSRKANAVQLAIRGPIEAACPASILRKHAHAVLYLDQDSASML